MPAVARATARDRASRGCTRDGSRWCDRDRGQQTRGEPSDRNRAARTARLLHAKTINHPHGRAVISLAGPAIVLGINHVETGMFVVHLDQANGPALLEFHVEAASAHPGRGPAPMTVGIEASLAFQVVTGIARTDQHLAKRGDLVPV